MYFLLASVIAFIGIVILLRATKPNPDSNRRHRPLIDTDRWIESWEFSLQKIMRKILRILVVHMVSWYRFIVYDMNIHKNMRQKVRELLYEHYREEKREKSTPRKEILE